MLYIYIYDYIYYQLLQCYIGSVDFRGWKVEKSGVLGIVGLMWVFINDELINRKDLFRRAVVN